MKVAKTVKLFINGAFPRTESGRSFPVKHHGQDQIYAELSLSSRKDARAAVEAAISGHSKWKSASPFNRGLVLYRLAEMLEGKRVEAQDILTSVFGLTKPNATKEIDRAIDG